MLIFNAWIFLVQSRIESWPADAKIGLKKQCSTERSLCGHWRKKLLRLKWRWNLWPFFRMIRLRLIKLLKSILSPNDGVWQRSLCRNTKYDAFSYLNTLLNMATNCYSKMTFYKLLYLGLGVCICRLYMYRERELQNSTNSDL